MWKLAGRRDSGARGRRCRPAGRRSGAWHRSPSCRRWPAQRSMFSRAPGQRIDGTGGYARGGTAVTGRGSGGSSASGSATTTRARYPHQGPKRGCTCTPSGPGGGRPAAWPRRWNGSHGGCLANGKDTANVDILRRQRPGQRPSRIDPGGVAIQGIVVVAQPVRRPRGLEAREELAAPVAHHHRAAGAGQQTVQPQVQPARDRGRPG